MEQEYAIQGEALFQKDNIDLVEVVVSNIGSLYLVIDTDTNRILAWENDNLEYAIQAFKNLTR
jgi:hypothetical protein